MSHANLSPAALGRATGKTGGAVTQWLDGTIKSIKGDTAAKIQDATGYNASWLATGKGDRLPAQSGVNPPDYILNQPLASGSIAQSAIDINSVRQGDPSAHEVVEALVILMAAIEPGRRDAVATLASGLARNPADTLLADLLVKILAPAAFAQPFKRSA